MRAPSPTRIPHSVVDGRSGRWFLVDCGSFNGTLLNDVRLQPGSPNPLRHGDRIKIGSLTLLFSCPGELVDAERTENWKASPSAAATLSPYQRQVVSCLCAPWLKGGTLDELPSNEQIAAQLGTGDAGAAVKAALRRAYAKAGLSARPPFAKRQALCRVARERGWILGGPSEMQTAPSERAARADDERRFARCRS